MSARQELLQICLEEMEREGLTVDQCLTRHCEAATELAPLLSAAERYRRAPVVRPSTTFRDAARIRMLNLMAAAEVQPPFVEPLPLRRPGSRWSLLLRMGVAVLALLLLATGGSSLVMAAVPDSPFYPAKLALEEARVRLARSDEERAALYLGMAQERSLELQQMAGRASDAQVDRVVGYLESAAGKAVAESMSDDAKTAALATLEESFAREERQIGGVSDGLGATESRKRIALEGAIRFLEQERAQIRLRLREKVPQGESGFVVPQFMTPGAGEGWQAGEATQRTPAPMTAAPVQLSPATQARKGADMATATATLPAEQVVPPSPSPLSPRSVASPEASTPETSHQPDNAGPPTNSTPEMVAAQVSATPASQGPYGQTPPEPGPRTAASGSGQVGPSIPPASSGALTATPAPTPVATATSTPAPPQGATQPGLSGGGSGYGGRGSGPSGGDSGSGGAASSTPRNGGGR